MTYRKWTESELSYLRRMYGFVPMSTICTELGRTPQAIIKRITKDPSIQVPEKRPDILMPGAFTRAMGMKKWHATQQVLKTAPFAMTMYRRNGRVRVAVLSDLKRWLADPLNWADIDETRILDVELAAIVRKAKASDRDRWLTMREAAKYLSYSYNSLRLFVQAGRLTPTIASKGLRGKRVYLFRKSELDEFIKAGR